MEDYEIPYRNTPLETRTVQNSMTGQSGDWTVTITLTGGVTMETPNAYLVEGYSENLMPQNFRDLISDPELNDLIEFLLAQK